MRDIQEDLLSMQDKDYLEFQSKLIPNLSKETMIGIRTPALRAYAKKIAGSPEATVFLETVNHRTYEENNLHMMLIGQIKEYPACMEKVLQFLPSIDNWATCDLPLPKIFSKHKEELIVEIRQWLKSEHPYTVRYGIGCLMRLYLDEDFKEEYLEWVSQVSSDQYYVQMMVAWYFATALAKQWETALPYLMENKLSIWIHNKTIQKARESRRLSKEKKDELDALKR